jgi:hypothetical protein
MLWGAPAGPEEGNDDRGPQDGNSRSGRERLQACLQGLKAYMKDVTTPPLFQVRLQSLTDRQIVCKPVLTCGCIRTCCSLAPIGLLHIQA